MKKTIEIPGGKTITFTDGGELSFHGAHMTIPVGMTTYEVVKGLHEKNFGYGAFVDFFYDYVHEKEDLMNRSAVVMVGEAYVAYCHMGNAALVLSNMIERIYEHGYELCAAKDIYLNKGEEGNLVTRTFFGATPLQRGWKDMAQLCRWMQDQGELVMEISQGDQQVWPTGDIMVGPVALTVTGVNIAGLYGVAGKMAMYNEMGVVKRMDEVPDKATVVLTWHNEETYVWAGKEVKVALDIPEGHIFWMKHVTFADNEVKVCHEGGSAWIEIVPKQKEEEQ
ncbi:MAG: hypothetical protein D6746_16070 [Bacteroidetes bacterium]|nr:MAG: hypothetical protein D6746_16070 [Bacteroidota bacterium]